MTMQAQNNDKDLAALLNDSALSKDEKIARLKAWKYDLEQRMVAAEENMEPAAPIANNDADQLQAVNEALLSLKA